MGILKSVVDFLLGKDADIFDSNGKVSHKLPKKKWDDWQNKYIQSQEYNWRDHSGTKANAKINEGLKPHKQK